MGAGEDPPLDRLRAAARLVENHEAVARFAARGCGSPGRQPVSAPLSDPTAKPGEEFLPDVDAGVQGSVCWRPTAYQQLPLILQDSHADTYGLPGRDRISLEQVVEE